MSTKVLNASDPQEEGFEVEPQAQQGEVDQEEQEPVDLELQKHMQKVIIDESVFTQQSKPKEKSQKKASKKKGQDFLDYANKNNIQIKLQYGEEDKRHSPSYEKPKMNDYSQQGPNQQKKPFRYANAPNGTNTNKYKPAYNKSNQQGRKVHVKVGGNKFDACNQMPFQYEAPQFLQQAPQHKEIALATEEQLLSYLERLLSLTSLNRDLYLRYRISDKGMISLLDISSYYGLKNNEVTPQRILDVIAKNASSSIGIIEEEGNIYLSIKHWNSILPQLDSIEAITAKKNQMKYHQTQAGMQPSPYAPYTYVCMQNNYYLPGYEMQASAYSQ